ncbi:MAG TPA: hypothetical protein PLJ21_06865 [Pseudobdellovibrionaceae bacterium]|nr:hypothetical protein [Pseudobdellovibrionaceae bacterium]
MNRAIGIAQNPILIAIDSNGTRVVSKSIDPIFDTEAVQFSKMFISKLYNFTPESFNENVGYASTFFSISLWKEEEQKFLELMKNVEKEKISMSTKLEKIMKNSDSEYSLELNILETTRLNSQLRKVSLKLFIQRTPRTKINPYGIEVNRYEENLIN